MSRPNVIWLSYDSLRADYFFGDIGGLPTPAPVLRSLFQRGYVFRNLWSAGVTTQMAMPCFMSGTLPLDFGGYNFGLRDRPSTVAEVFRQQGYRTASWNSGRAGSLEGGYERGFDDYHRLWGGLALYDQLHMALRYLHHGTKSGRIPMADAVHLLDPMLAAYSAQTAIYAEQKIQESRNGGISSAINTAHPTSTWETLAQINVHFARKHQRAPHRTCEDLIRWKDLFSLPMRVVNRTRRALGKHEVGWMSVLHYAQWIENNSTAAKHALCKSLPAIEFGPRHTPQQMDFPSLGWHLDELDKWLDRPREQPFFAYMVTCDTHVPWNWLTYEAVDDKQRLAGEIETLRDYATAVQAAGGAANENELKYLLSIRYVDFQTQRMLDMLRRRGQLENTVFVLMSDHGTTTPGRPQRPKLRPPEAWWNELYHVPAAIIGPGITPGVFDGYATAIDFPSTVFDLLGLPTPASFRGTSTLRQPTAGREHVLTENMGCGICDMDWKPLNIAVRRQGYKIVCELPGRKTPEPPRILECYDLDADPGETRNLATSPPDAVAPLREIAEDRARSILAEAATVGL